MLNKRSVAMKKVSYLTFILVLLTGLLLITGCSSVPENAVGANDQAAEESSEPGEQPAEESNETGDQPAATGDQNTMPLQTQLAVGTLKLEETELAVTSDQAAELLSLWKAARSLSESDNVAAEEMNAIFTQIQETMAPEQLDTINAMELTNEDLRELFPEMEQIGNISPERQATMEAMRESGQGPPEGFTPGGMGGGQGGPPMGEGGGMPMGGGAPPEGFSGEEGDTAPRGGGFGTAIYDPVIDLLEGKLE
jgi:hypothetical protein